VGHLDRLDSAVTAVRAVLILAGMAGMALAVYGILFGGGTNPGGQLMFLILLVIAHDLVLLPLVIGLGAVILRFVPAPGRAAVQGGLSASVVVIVLALPFVLGFGRMPSNATVLPLNYWHGLLIMLGVIWAVAAAFLAWNLSRATPAPPRS
jgi:hypothetical protein